ncbi:cyclic nucleotide-binding domain-containing protein [Marinomonas mediterranea]|jgi:cAMP-binding proteins - catabolite gene activator and regulatory subunit of cAMP-dependent protein kinases|uniref:Cyclic nucleotide-binding protein n=1 Tax=Marinomonas mediterranea (strain ATCC 700492 / JCM 21426 / NBRC 103028 / MMB-1) TaxID=717774 RepID=F2JY68_MARM1|nr:cyclic nucleotide-binding domain-containing protein [Marinomonas mediterranea]ADZ90804.1 cyclic nucleotide-binding protein [Marinomonas mediterranea MMB-1]WCN08844.1 cyclic nucleotide-binding domain-containing protein [Marinomonas mediterranea]WCN12889.1 cyclic nucleotide-binding domain-containing protein [Marinomonas mediterranea]WCN16957.1 cyclic nucleotide-binding domain-containing protein [Marinomonas mediterranea MMB-1]
MKKLNIHDCPYDLSIERLKTASIFGALGPDAIEFLLTNGNLEEFEEGETVFEKDEVADGFYIILDGEIELFKDKEAYEKAMKFGEGSIGFGEELGYCTMIALLPRAANARTSKKTLVLKVDSYVFGQFHDYYAFDFGILILNLSRDMARKLRLLSGTLSEHDITVDRS